MNRPLFLGVEIGGTKLQLGVGAGDGSPLLALETTTVQRERGAAGILAGVERLANRLLDRFDVHAVGIGFGGPVNAEAGRTTLSHHVPGWEDFPLAEWCRQKFGSPVVLGNDCDVAALAEARHGAAAGRSIVLYVTVGTGIGGGLVVDGRLFGTARPAVAEIGHLRPGLELEAVQDTRAASDACRSALQAGPTAPETTAPDVEALASGTGIERRARTAVERQPADSPDVRQLAELCGGDLRQLTARHVAEAAASGNRLARTVLRQSVEVLGWAVAQAVTLVAAEVVVVGGGVSLAGEELFFRPLRQAANRYVFHALRGAFEIVPARFGQQVVVQGALTLAAEHAQSR